MNSLRISGMASGMDTETMIKDLMKVEMQRVNKHNKSKQMMLWKQEAYNSTNKDFANFILDAKKELELTKSTIYGTSYNNSIKNLSWVKKAVSSDEGIFTAKATSSAMGGTHKIKVHALATGVNVASQDKVKLSNGNVAKASNTLGEMGVSSGTHELKFEIDVNGSPQSVTIPYSDTDSISKLVERINTAAASNSEKTPLMIQANFDDVSGRLFLATKNTGSTAKIKVVSDNQGLLTGADNKFNVSATFSAESLKEIKDVNGAAATLATSLDDLGITDIANGSLKLKINGTLVNVNLITKSDGSNISNMSDLVDAINESASQNCVFFDETTHTLKFDTSVVNNISVVEDSKELFTGQNKFQMGIGGLLGGTTGQDAVIDFDGATNLTYSSNNFMINGIEMNLKALPANHATSEYTVKVDTDTESVFTKIKAFVDKYNEIIDKMNGKVNEKVYRDYKPLTSEEKEAMKEDDIKRWEEKAKSGLLRADENISRTLSTMRSGLYESVTGDGITAAFSHLTALGISTGDYKNKGKLEIDENKLKDAINKDVDSVLNLLFKQSTTTETDGFTDSMSASAKEAKRAENIKKMRSESGVITRVFDDMVDGMKKIIYKSGTGDNTELYRKVQSNILIDFVTGNVTGIGSISFIDQDILKVDKTINREQDRLAKTEQRYWQKFTAMEKAMQQMNSQSSWLAQQLGGGR